jgi:hypothetical protein
MQDRRGNKINRMDKEQALPENLVVSTGFPFSTGFF